MSEYASITVKCLPLMTFRNYLSSDIVNLFFSKQDLVVTSNCKIDEDEDAETYTQYVYRTTVKKAKERLDARGFSVHNFENIFKKLMIEAIDYSGFLHHLKADYDEYETIKDTVADLTLIVDKIKYQQLEEVKKIFDIIEDIENKYKKNIFDKIKLFFDYRKIKKLLQIISVVMVLLMLSGCSLLPKEDEYQISPVVVDNQKISYNIIITSNHYINSFPKVEPSIVMALFF